MKRAVGVTLSRAQAEEVIARSIEEARTWPLGTSLTVTNPRNGRSLTVRVNDTGPWGLSYKMGARLDLARGAAQRLGMTGTQYVCVA